MTLVSSNETSLAITKPSFRRPNSRKHLSISSLLNSFGAKIISEIDVYKSSYPMYCSALGKSTCCQLNFFHAIKKDKSTTAHNW